MAGFNEGKEERKEDGAGAGADAERGAEGNVGGRTAMESRPGVSCLRVKFSSSKARVP